MSRLAVGVDYGGTKVLAAVVDVDSGKVLGTGKKRTSASDGGEELMKRVYSTIDDALKTTGTKAVDLVGIGVGIAGQVDPEYGLLVGTANLSRSVVDLPMAKMLTERYAVQAHIRNDVHIAAIGEARFGAGRDADDFVCIFVGTGIGGAMVRGGTLVTGWSGNAGEIGHTTVQADGRVCGCGGRGHLEAYASRTGMTAAIYGEWRRGHKTIISGMLPDVDPAAPGNVAIKSGVLLKAVQAGDEVVTQIVLDAGRYLGMGLASVVNFVNPQRIILGGGVIEALDLLYNTAERWTRAEALTHAGEAVQFSRAGLGDNSGAVGAAVIAAEANA
ncbi:MAG: ROK family protein [Thermomicrobiales bacterium]